MPTLPLYSFVAFLVTSAASFSASAEIASFTPLGDPRGGSFSGGALDVSGDGSTVVGRRCCRSGSDGVPGNEALIWDATNGMQGLGDLPGGDFRSRALAVSADGSTVLGFGTSGVASVSEAFIWDATDGMQRLDDLTGGGFSAVDVSADGSTLVGGGTSASGTGAFIWDATNGKQSLQVLLTALGVDLTLVQGHDLFRVKRTRSFPHPSS